MGSPSHGPECRRYADGHYECPASHSILEDAARLLINAGFIVESEKIMRDIERGLLARGYDEACEHDVAVCRDKCSYNPYR